MKTEIELTKTAFNKDEKGSRSIAQDYGRGIGALIIMVLVALAVLCAIITVLSFVTGIIWLGVLFAIPTIWFTYVAIDNAID